MGRWLLRRLVSLAAVLMLVTAGSYALIDLLPGDPALAILGFGATPARAAALRTQLELDKPWPVRYVHWVGKVAHGDFGRSRRYTGDVSKVLRARMPRTVQLLVFAELLALVIAVPLGTWAGWRANTRVDRAISSVAFGAMALPPFMLGLLLVFVLAVKNHWLPSSGYRPFFGDPLGALRTMLLPGLTLALPLAAIQVRALRADVAETAESDHVLLARANGLSTWRILVHHVLRQSSLTMLTIVVITLPWILSFVVVVEKLFNTFGAGELLSEAVTARDFLLIQGVVLAFALLYLVVSLGIELVQTVLDPRVRRSVRA
jgi:peptide/nickel transport system permease protein